MFRKVKFFSSKKKKEKKKAEEKKPEKKPPVKREGTHKASAPEKKILTAEGWKRAHSKKEKTH